MLPIESGITIDSIVLLVFYFVAIIFLTFTLIMYYHWNEFSPDKKVSRLTAIIYLLTTLPIIAGLTIISLFFF